MGIEIDRTQFSAEDFECFGRRLEENLADLRGLLDTPGFGEGPPSLGAELEIYIVDDDGNPLHANQEIHAAAADPRLTLELNRYNLEYNLTPGFVAEGAFSATEREIIECLGVLESLAADHGGRAVAIGILPTLRQSDFGPASITDRRRYHALVEQLIQRRGSAFRIDINGRDPLQLDMADITLEGANTSFQVHLRVDPADYVATFNAIQLVTPLVLGICANSPGLFGHELWDETRIPLFKQAIDTRHTDRYRWHEPARVCFGHGWVRHDAAELFEQTVRLYRPLLPACGEAASDERDPPALDELRLHQSTVWLWNRPVYDDAAGGHLRVEMRALPAGPSAVDMVAGAALMLGLARGLRDRMDRLVTALPFSLAEYNFYRAAQHGLGARLVWPSERQHGLSDAPVTDLIDECLPLAADGLAAIGTPREEIERYLGIIAARLASRRTGASWQLDMLHRLGGDVPGTDAFHEMLFRFMSNAEKNLPVAEWPL
jgi:hypothetical protein